MPKVIEVTACANCPWNKNNSCTNPDTDIENFDSLVEPEVIFPGWCPLADKDDYLESEFDIDKEE